MPLNRKGSMRKDSGFNRSSSIFSHDPELSDTLKRDKHHKREGTGLFPVEEEHPPAQTSTASYEKAAAVKTTTVDAGPQLEAARRQATRFNNFSPLQKARLQAEILRTDPFVGDATPVFKEDVIVGLQQFDAEELRTHFPKTFDLEVLKIWPANVDTWMSASSVEGGISSPPPVDGLVKSACPVTIGMVLSGGPAPGGHNVIAGVYDFITEQNPGSILYGFKGGLDGLFNKEYIQVNSVLMNSFRNTGGFDMFWSGRGKVSDAKMADAKAIVEDLKLDGLIIVGGDGSNSNAALLAEYFAANQVRCAVVGVPKTIDGDLKNAAIECSFGFDTAAKTYSELVGNLTVDAGSGQGVWHIVKIMGRTASHLVLETSLQTRPNLVYIGEEVEAKSVSLESIVSEIADVMQQRYEAGRDYGIVLVPEGLIAFIPEMVVLTDDLAAGHLSPQSQAVWDTLPEEIKLQLQEERENTGYIQPAKISTDRLLKILVENHFHSLRKANQSAFRPNIMAHYFGYEGRCAMPSVFDATYCYNLGLTAGLLASQKKNGYMAVVLHLDQPTATDWRPAGVPFSKLMKMIDLSGKRFPGIIRQLVDLESETFKVFNEVRDAWKMGDYYRCPGPIQFSGPGSNQANYVVAVPSKEELLSGDEYGSRFKALGRAKIPKRFGCYSPLQMERLKFVPPIPDICNHPRAIAVKKHKWMPEDPYLLRQIQQHFGMLSKRNDFWLQEMNVPSSKKYEEEDGESSDDNTPNKLRVGVVFVSRPSPGMNNIIWGVHERLKKLRNGSECLGFYGVDGVMEEKYIVITDADLEAYKNLGGQDLLGRCADHKLLIPENRKKVYEVCGRLKLDGLVLIGSSLAMTEAAMLTQTFLEQDAKRDPPYGCSVIGVPATPSNNVFHELIETSVGFDTATKIYSSLIGNVLTDAASMPKYWHFIRLMGRQPSNEVLECALQTHPNVVLVSEEYGAGQKTLNDVVKDIADAVCARAAEGKNFGAVLIPEGLWEHLPTMKTLQKELDEIIRAAIKADQLEECRNDFLSENFRECLWSRRLTPWSSGVWESLPIYIQEAFLTDNPELRSNYIELETLLSEMVGRELEERANIAKAKTVASRASAALTTFGGQNAPPVASSRWRYEDGYSGLFQCVKHYFGYQGRSGMPSLFDSSLGLTHGHLATMCIESKLTGYITSVRGLCEPAEEWMLYAVPLTCLLCLIPIEQNTQLHPQLGRARNTEGTPVIPNAEINLQSKALRALKMIRESWINSESYSNPGPIQYTQFSPNKDLQPSLTIQKDRAEYGLMLKHVQQYTKELQDACSFGTDYYFLKYAYVSLKGLMVLRNHPDNLLEAMQPILAAPDAQPEETTPDTDLERPSRNRTMTMMARTSSIIRGGPLGA